MSFFLLKSFNGFHCGSNEIQSLISPYWSGSFPTHPPPLLSFFYLHIIFQPCLPFISILWEFQALSHRGLFHMPFTCCGVLSLLFPTVYYLARLNLNVPSWERPFFTQSDLLLITYFRFIIRGLITIHRNVFIWLVLVGLSHRQGLRIPTPIIVNPVPPRHHPTAVKCVGLHWSSFQREMSLYFPFFLLVLSPVRGLDWHWRETFGTCQGG